MALFLFVSGSGSLAAMAVFEDGYKVDMTVRSIDIFQPCVFLTDIQDLISLRAAVFDSSLHLPMFFAGGRSQTVGV